MKNFDIKPMDWKRTYYPNPRSTVSFTEAWDRSQGENDEVYSTTTSYYLTKTISYTNEKRYKTDIDNLSRLKEAKFDIVKIPEYKFEYSDMTIQYTCQYLKGYYTKQESMFRLYKDLVERDSEYTFADYNVMNFITVNHPCIQGIYAIDLNSYRKCSKELRRFLWERYYSMPNPDIYS
tara:strand:- start:4240 stop:4773 length:534 start_codon:yes stop_codon:yes gene_type:complete